MQGQPRRIIRPNQLLPLRFLLTVDRSWVSLLIGFYLYIWLLKLFSDMPPRLLPVLTNQSIYPNHIPFEWGSCPFTAITVCRLAGLAAPLVPPFLLVLLLFVLYEVPFIWLLPFEIIWWYLFIYSSFVPPISTEFFLCFEKSTSVAKPAPLVAADFLVFMVFFFLIGVLLSLWPSDELRLLRGSFLSVLELDPIMALLFDIEPIGLLL